MICTYMVCTCMYSVHKHNSFPIRPNQPCDAGESLLHAQSVPILPVISFLTQALFATSKLPQPQIYLIHIAP